MAVDLAGLKSMDPQVTQFVATVLREVTSGRDLLIRNDDGVLKIIPIDPGPADPRDPVTVSFQISGHTARYFRSYASLGRWCDAITRMCDELPEGKVVDEKLSQDIGYIDEDVAAMKPVISEIHLAMREALVKLGVKPLWDQNQGAFSSRPAEGALGE